MAVVAVPDEPGAVMLPEAATYQAVAADVDSDGTREVARLVSAASGAVEIEVWTDAGGSWVPLGDPVEAAPAPTGSQGEVVYAGAPFRLIVRSIGGLDRVTLVRQPRFEEPGLSVACCLLLDDLMLDGGVLRLVPVTERSQAADAVLALDMDGDGTDELLVTRGLPPLGDTTFPTEVRLYRWAGNAFAPPVVTEIGVGSGVSPFVLGDSDGAPGEEAAFVAAQSRLHRVSLRAGDAVVAEDGGTSVADAVAVPFEDGVGIAIASRLDGLSVRSWPRDAPLGEPSMAFSANVGSLVGVVTAQETPQLLVRGSEVETLQRLALPTLTPLTFNVTRSPAAGTLSGGPPVHVGMLPGGGPDGRPAAIYAGHLLPFEAAAQTLMAALPGVAPVGLVGEDRRWLALWHRATLPTPASSPDGGRLDVPQAVRGSGVSIVPLGVALTPEIDDAVLEPPLEGTVADRRAVIAGAAGFVARIAAPEGSRVYVMVSDALIEVLVVPTGGVLAVPIGTPVDAESNPRYRARLLVVTPAGHGYLAAWDVHLLNRPPSVDARAITPFGSASVVIDGRTDPATEVRVDGQRAAVEPDGAFRAEVELPPWPTSVEVVAVDRVGNESRLAVSGVGWFDYRALPWIPLAVALVGLAGIVLFLRVPRVKREPRRADDDAAVEEIDLE